MAPIKALLFDAFGSGGLAPLCQRELTLWPENMVQRQMPLKADAGGQNISQPWKKSEPKDAPLTFWIFCIGKIWTVSLPDLTLTRSAQKTEMSLILLASPGLPDSVKGQSPETLLYPCHPVNGNIALIVNMAKGADLAWDVVLGAEVTGYYKPRPEAYDRACLPLACLMRPV